jgi:O-antigen/teichoic acid export membrane protein
MKNLALYTILKYVEFGVTALLTILLASRVSAQDYGSAAIFFVTVSYLQFASFGSNQVLIKWYAKKKTDDEGYVVINLMFWITFFACCLIILFCIYSNSILLLFAFIVSILKLIYESLINIFRVKELLHKINILSVIFSLIFFFSVFFLGFSIQSYFLCWIFSFFISIMIGFFLLPRNTIDFKVFWGNRFLVFNFLGDGFFMLIINFITLSLTTMDRSILNYYLVSESLIGSVQLVDIITNGITLSVTSIIFVLLPKIYILIKDSVIPLNKLYKIGISSIFLFLSIFLGSFFLVSEFITSYVSKYPEFKTHFCLQMLSKSLLLLTTIPYAFMIINSKEFLYFKIYFCWVLFTFFGYIFFIQFRNIYFPITVTFNLVLIVGCVFLNFHYYLIMKKIYN